MSFIHACTPCEGRGYYGLLPSNTCAVCHGYGALTLHGQVDDYRTCGPCEGRGYYGLLSSNTCKVCGGLGLLTQAAPPTVTLPDSGEMDGLWALIHPKIAIVARERFESRHFADSVEAALKEVNHLIKLRVKTLTGNEWDGADLMYKAFSTKNPLIKLGDLSTTSGENIQQGYMQLFAGAMIGIRNPKAHENITISRNRAVHLLFLASLLIHRLDEAT